MDSFNKSTQEEKVNSTRVIVILGAILFIVYSIMDYFGLPKETLKVLYPTRALLIIILATIFVLTFKPVFQKHYLSILTFGYYCCGITISIGAYVSQAGDYSFDLYFTALIILVITAFSWSYLPIKYSVLMSAVFITTYVVIKLFFHQDIEGNRAFILISHVFYLFSVGLIAAIAQYIRDNLIYKNLKLQQSLHNIAEEQSQEAKKQEQLANLDALTGIPNQRYITECLRKALIEAEQNQTLLTLVYIDLNGLKQINDTYGHDSGDKVLEITSKRLSQTIREEDYLARLGGDEFLIGFKTNQFSAEFINRLCNKIRINITAPIAFNGHKLQLGTSIGVANYPADGADIETLIKVADKQTIKTKQSSEYANISH